MDQQALGSKYWSLIAAIGCLISIDIYRATIIDMDAHKWIAAQAISRRDEDFYYFALLEGYDSIFLNSLINRNYDQALVSGLKYSKLFACLGDKSRDAGTVAEPETLDDFVPRSLSLWIEWVPFLVLEPILMVILTADDIAEVSIGKWSEVFIETFGRDSPAMDFLEGLQRVINASFGEKDALDEIRESAYGSDGVSYRSRLLSTLALCGSRYANINDALSAQFRVLNILNQRIEESHWIVFYFEMIKARWQFLAREQKFLLRAPSFWSKTILDALEGASPSVPDLARILLLIGEATGMSWQSEMLDRLNQCTHSRK